jgi:TRAP transporter T-component
MLGILMRVLPWFFMLAVMSCSLRKTAIRTVTPVFEQASLGFMTEENWDFFRESAPANIKLIELLWQQSPENEKLLAMTIKSYAGYAFGIYETLSLSEELSSSEVTPYKDLAISYYTKTFDLGLRYLKLRGLNPQDFLQQDEKRLVQKISNLGDEDNLGILYFAQAWASLINLQKNNLALISQVPKVKLLFDHVCHRNPQIDYGVCDIFYAQYEASRPKMLGGDPEKGEMLFKSAMQKYPYHLLIRVQYLQSVVIPTMDKEKYDLIADDLRKQFQLLGDLNRDQLESSSPYIGFAHLNLYNAIAKKRFEIIEKYKDKIF